MEAGGHTTSARGALVTLLADATTFEMPGIRATASPVLLIWPMVPSWSVQLNEPSALVTSTPLLNALAVNCRLSFWETQDTRGALNTIWSSFKWTVTGMLAETLSADAVMVTAEDGMVPVRHTT